MNDTIKKFTAEIREAISAHLQSQEMQDFIAATKAAEDTGSFEVVISTADVDRDGENIDQNGWDLSFYQMNPVVLWAHDYSSLPIAICESITIKDGKLVALGKFAPESANPFAQQVRRLYDLKIVRATSVGFIAQEMNGRTITKAQLLEFSFVPVPANPYALSLSKAVEMGLNTEMLAMKGIKFEEAEAKKDLPETPGDNPGVQQPEEGKPCKLADGADGTYQVDGSGALVCMAAKSKQPTDQEPQEGQPCIMPDGSSGITQIDENGTLACVPQYEEKPEVTANYIRLPIKDAANYDDASIRTIDIDAGKGIKALVACPKGSYEGGKCGVGTEIITYLFDKDKWSESEAQAWVDSHKKAAGAIHEPNPMNCTTCQEAIKTAVAAHQKETKTAVVAHTQKIAEIVARHYGELVKQAIKSNESLPPEGSEGEERSQDGSAPKQRSNGAGYDDKEALDAFLSGRQVLRLVNNVTSEALRKLNERSRPKTHGSKRS